MQDQLCDVSRARALATGSDNEAEGYGCSSRPAPRAELAEPCSLSQRHGRQRHPGLLPPGAPLGPELNREVPPLLLCSNTCQMGAGATLV